MLCSRSFIVLCIAALACMPKLNGVCGKDADCKTGESCSADGLCLRSASSTAGGDAGNSGAGDAGNSGASDAGNSGAADAGTPDAGNATAAAAIDRPAASTFVPRVFPVSATATTDGAAIADVTFLLNAAGTDAGLGSAVVTSAAGKTWSNTFSIDNPAFNGGAVLRAVAHRTGAADIGAASIAISIDQVSPALTPQWTNGVWRARDAGISVTAAVSDTGSGVASGQLQVEGGNTYPAFIASGTATFTVPATEVADAGTAVTRFFSLVVADAVGNATIVPVDAGLFLSVDDVPPAISPIPDNSWHNSATNVVATISDVGSGVSTSSVLFAAGPSVPGQHGAGTAWSYPLDVANQYPSFEGPVSYQIIAADVAGNIADAGGVIQIDTKPPTIAPQPLSGADYTDDAGTPFFKGPTIAPAAANIVLTAIVSDGYLDTTPANKPAAFVGATRYPGSLSGGPWSFSIPRSVGQNATAAVKVGFDAQDLAGNHPSPLPAVQLQFDDMPASGFTPAVATDTGWYARGTSVNVPVTLTLPAVPRSGIRSVALKVAGQTDVTCSASGGGYSCVLPTTYAPAGVEAPLNFSVVATSNVGIASTGTGSRNIDDVLPVISNAAAVSYPPAASGNLAWSHDGAHFNLREGNITIYTFTAYDCGAGVKNIVSATLSPSPGVRGAALAASSNTAACPAGRPNATIYNVAVTADLSTTAAGSFVNADNTLSISASVADGASDGAGGFPHTSTSSQTATVTRRLWQTGAISAGQLAMGPVLIVATPSGIINGLARADGSAAWPAAAGAYPLFSGPAVGGTASSPTVYYGLNNNAPSNGPSVFSLSAASGLSGSSCNAQAFVTRPAICSAAPLVRWRLSQFLALATDGSAAILEDDESDAATATGADCGAEGYGGIRMVGATCSIWIPALTVQSSTSSIGFLPSASGLAIGRNGRAFYVDRSHPQEIAVSGGAITSGSGVTCTKTSIITDSNGNDAPVCNGEHLVFSSGFGKDWSASFTTPLDAIGLLFGNASGSTQPYALASGSTAALTAAASRIPWAIDASNPPVIYLSSAATLYAQRLSVAGIGASVWALPSVPGTAITDVVMDNAGVLYVSSNGQVSAMVTDSPGLGTGSNGWPIAGHDACRSYNLEYQCPW